MDILRVSSNCVICGEKLLQYTPPLESASQSEEWLYSFRILPGSFDQGIELTNPVAFISSDRTIRTDIPRSPNHASRSVTIYPFPLRNSSCCFHECCWRLLKLLRPWAQLAHVQALTNALCHSYRAEADIPSPLVDWRTISRAQAWLLGSSSSTLNTERQSEIKDRDSLDLFRLLTCIPKKLPPELISIIWTYFPQCPVRSLLSVAAGGFADLLDNITPYQNIRSGYISCDGHITAYVMAIGREEYICGLDDGERLCGYRSNKQTEVSIDSTISKIRFIKGRYGIIRIWIHCQEGTVKSVGGVSSESDSSTWAGFFNQTTPFVKFWWDGLKLLDVYPMEEGPAPFGERFLWNSDIPISLTNTLSAGAYRKYVSADSVSSLPWPVLHLLPWARVQHLPLSSDKEKGYLYGITAYSTLNGIKGMGAHFRHPLNGNRTIWIGSKKGHAIHFRLKATEVITNIWTTRARRDGTLFTIYITIGTSENRTCSFGPAPQPSDVSRTLFAVRGHEKISGLYFHLKEEDQRNLSSVGIGVYCSSEKNAGKSPWYNIDTPPVLYPELPPCSIRGLYVSQATLSDVQEINICSLRTRCVAMMITHKDGSQDVLGQWHEGSLFKHTILYQNHHVHSQPAKLYFKLFVKYKSVLRSVALEPFPGTPNDSEDFIFKEVNFGDTVVWWFDFYKDIIQ